MVRIIRELVKSYGGLNSGLQYVQLYKVNEGRVTRFDGVSISADKIQDKGRNKATLCLCVSDDPNRGLYATNETSLVAQARGDTPISTSALRKAGLNFYNRGNPPERCYYADSGTERQLLKAFEKLCNDNGLVIEKDTRDLHTFSHEPGYVDPKDGSPVISELLRQYEALQRKKSDDPVPAQSP